MKIYQPLYDCERVEPDTISVYFFQKPLGGTSKGAVLKDRSHASVTGCATQLDTNMDQAKSLASPKIFTITGLSLVPSLDHPRIDVSNFMRSAWARLFIDRCDYLVLPAQFLYKKPNQFDINEPVFKFDEPITLDCYPNEFRVEVNSVKPAPCEAFDLYCILHGYFDTRLYRATQEES